MPTLLLYAILAISAFALCFIAANNKWRFAIVHSFNDLRVPMLSIPSFDELVPSDIRTAHASRSSESLGKVLALHITYFSSGALFISLKALRNAMWYLINLFNLAVIRTIEFIWLLPQYFTTLYHELGHALSLLPLGMALPALRLSYNGGGSTHTFSVGEQYGTTWQHILYTATRSFCLLTGYSAPIVAGVVFLFSSTEGTLTFNAWVIPVVITLFVMSFVFALPVIGFIGGYLAIPYWFCLAGLVISLFLGGDTFTVSYTDFGSWLLVAVGVFALVSARSFFTFLFLALYFLIGAMALSGSFFIAAPAVLFTVGILLICGGIFDLIFAFGLVSAEDAENVDEHPNDFSFAADEMDTGTPKTWYWGLVAFTVVACALVSLPFLLSGVSIPALN